MTSPHDKTAPHADEGHQTLIDRHQRVALVLFFVYLAAYGGFMGLSALAPQVMGRVGWRGVNVAILYGLGLIAGAVVLAVVYMIACRWISARYHAENRRP